VLVGGNSSRMGRDKALLRVSGVSGETLGQAVAGMVAEAAGNAVLVGDPARYGGMGYAVIPDLFPGEGPLGGILTALAHTSAEWNLMVACDMPALSALFLRKLLDAAEEEDADALLPAGPSGRPEPLCAVYRKGSRAALEAGFQAGIRKITQAACGAEGLRTVVLPVAEVSVFQNVNTPEEWAEHGAE